MDWKNKKTEKGEKRQVTSAKVTPLILSASARGVCSLVFIFLPDLSINAWKIKSIYSPPDEWGGRGEGEKKKKEKRNAGEYQRA